MAFSLVPLRDRSFITMSYQVEESIYVFNERTQRKDLKVEAEVYDHLLAVHPRVDHSGWTLTHIPTGAVILHSDKPGLRERHKTPAGLGKLAKNILESGVNLRFANPKRIPPETKKSLRQLILFCCDE